jgi:hypothetical protein
MKPAPAIATRLLERTCADTQHESVTGDVLEQYQLGRSRLWYWWQVSLIVLVRTCRMPLRRPRVSEVRRPSPRMIGSLSFFVMLLVGATDTRIPDPAIRLLLFGIVFCFLGLEIVRFWYKLRPQIQVLDLVRRTHRTAALYTSVLKRPLGLPL